MADAFTLFSMLENKLEEHPGQLTRAAVEVAKIWRKDKHLRLDVSWASSRGSRGHQRCSLLG